MKGNIGERGPIETTTLSTKPPTHKEGDKVCQKKNDHLGPRQGFFAANKRKQSRREKRKVTLGGGRGENFRGGRGGTPAGRGVKEYKGRTQKMKTKDCQKGGKGSGRGGLRGANWKTKKSGEANPGQQHKKGGSFFGGWRKGKRGDRKASRRVSQPNFQAIGSPVTGKPQNLRTKKKIKRVIWGKGGAARTGFATKEKRPKA